MFSMILKVGLTMRDKILAVSRKLFYEQGYNETRFSQIAEELGITKGLITYYFGKKSKIAMEVHTDYTRDIHNKVSSQLYSMHRNNYKYEPNLVRSISQICSLNMYKFDEKARNFYIEHMSANLQFNIEQTYLPWFVEQKKKNLGDEILDSQSIKIQAFAERGARATVILGFFRKELDLSFEEIVDYSIGLSYKFVRETDSRTLEMLNLTKKIFLELSIEYLPYFNIVMK